MQARLGLFFLFSLVLSLATGCDNLFGGGLDFGSSEGAPSGGDYDEPPPTTGCSADAFMTCPGVAMGFACAPGSSPSDEDSNLSCSPQTVDAGGGDEYCCLLTGIAGTSCTPKAVVCPYDESIGLQCLPGDSPDLYDGSLACDDPTTDADGVHTDYCCSYELGSDWTGLGGGSGSSSGGSGWSSSGGGTNGDDGGTSGDGDDDGAALPAGCTTAPGVACTGAAKGYACVTGANPEADDPARACSAAQVRPGEDDYCCYEGFHGDPRTCVPDDALVSLCPGQTAYGFQCLAGNAPTQLDTSLVCEAPPEADADGMHLDFCCTRP